MDVTSEHWHEYYFSLGKFMHLFSHTENGLNAYLAQFLALSIVPTDSPKAYLVIKAAVGGQRLAPLKDALKRTLRVTRAPQDMRDRLDALLSHLSEIHYLRDRLAHNGAILVPRNGAVMLETSNNMTAREHEQIDTLYFGIDVLENMSADLMVMHEAIHATITPHVRPEMNLRDIPDLENALRHASAWRYKPSQLERVRPKSRATPPKQKPPQEPSPGSPQSQQ